MKPVEHYRWLVADPELLGGKLAIRGTRPSASFIVSCLAEGMSADEIEETYGSFPREAIHEILKIAAEALDTPYAALSSMPTTSRLPSA